MKKYLHLLLSIFLFTLLMAACGGTAKQDVIPTKAALTEEAPAEEPELTADDYIERGRNFYDQGELEKASVEFQAALELEPDNNGALTNLGMVYIDLGQYDQAISQYKTVLVRDTKNKAANGGLCVALAFTNPSQGESQCLAALKLDSQNADIYNGLGVALAKQQKTEEAMAAFQKTIEIDPEHRWAHNNLGFAHLGLGNYEQAVSELNKALEINPKNDLAYYNLGLAYARQGDYQQAIPNYEQAIKLNPEMPGAYNDLGLIYQELGQTEQAIVAFERYLELHPDDPSRDKVEAILAELEGSSALSTVFVNAQIAFVSERDGNMEIYSMNTHGSDLTRLTDNPAYDVEPAWSPDGMRIVFASDRNGNFDIYSMKADGTDIIQLTDDPANEFTPVWSSNGTHIAFMSERGGKPGLYLMKADGSYQDALITDPNSAIVSPTFSYAMDLLDLAFASNAQGAFDLYIHDGATYEIRKLTQGMGDVLTPDWSNNGRFIVFAANPSGNYELFIIRPDGTDINQLTKTDVNEYKPRWSPDSNCIMYSVGQKEMSEIEIRNENGEVMRLTNNAFFDGMPTWGPME